MDRSKVVYLVARTFQDTPENVKQPVETRRKVYCDIQSVGQKEWYEGGRNGLNPEFRAVMFAPDYHGERILEYNDHRYDIYRTYIGRNDSIELYCQKRQGVVSNGS